MKKTERKRQKRSVSWANHRGDGRELNGNKHFTERKAHHPGRRVSHEMADSELKKSRKVRRSISAWKRIVNQTGT